MAYNKICSTLWKKASISLYCILPRLHSAFCRVNRKSPECRLAFPSITARHYQPDLIVGGTHPSRSQFLSLRFYEPEPLQCKIKTKREKQAKRKKHHPLPGAFMMQVSRVPYRSEWKICDCLPEFQNITLTFSRSKRSSPPCLFSMKSLRFLKT